MTQFRCYKEKNILKRLGTQFQIIFKKEDDIFAGVFIECKDLKGTKCYMTNKDIKSIIELNGFWPEVIVNFTGGIENTVLYSDKVKLCDDQVQRISKNHFLSPYFYKQGEYILTNKDFDEWLVFNGIPMTELGEIASVIELEDVYFYHGLSEPVIEDGTICGDYNTVMKFSETEINEAVSNIKSANAKVKIEKILKFFGQRRCII